MCQGRDLGQDKQIISFGHYSGFPCQLSYLTHNRITLWKLTINKSATCNHISQNELLLKCRNNKNKEREHDVIISAPSLS